MQKEILGRAFSLLRLSDVRIDSQLMYAQACQPISPRRQDTVCALAQEAVWADRMQAAEAREVGQRESECKRSPKDTREQRRERKSRRFKIHQKRRAKRASMESFRRGRGEHGKLRRSSLRS